MKSSATSSSSYDTNKIKRRRREEEQEKEENDNVHDADKRENQLLQDLEFNDDDFLTEEEKYEKLAKQKRLQRRLKLRKIQERELQQYQQRQQQRQQQQQDQESGKKKNVEKVIAIKKEASMITTTKTTTAGDNGNSDNPSKNVSGINSNSDDMMKLEYDEQRVHSSLTGKTMMVSKLADNENNDDNEDDDDDDDDDDGFDMFSSSVSPVVDKNNMNTTGATTTTTTKRGVEQQDWDDAEGYYKAVIGEVITFNPTNNDHGSTKTTTTTKTSTEATGTTTNSDDISFRVLGVIGKGVFSTVLKCTTTHNSTSIMLPPFIAMKCIRHNETMAKTALNEIKYLQRLQGSSGIIQLLLPTTTTTTTTTNNNNNNNNNYNNNNYTTTTTISSSPILEHRGHVIMCFPYMEYNLRDVLQKFGKGVGLSLQAVKSYFGQLLSGLMQLKKHGIIHADLKPDNILVNHDFSIVRICDFGSAIDVSANSNDPSLLIPTPYLCSRYYRSPEIILGLLPTYGIDLWSLAVSIVELYVGNVIFRGNSNNDMLYTFMQYLGPFSNRLIRQHFVQCQRMILPTSATSGTGGAGDADHHQQQRNSNKSAIPKHFINQNNYYQFLQQTFDQVTGQPVHKCISLQTFPTIPITRKLLKAKSIKDSRTVVLQFSDLISKCLTLDPTRRIALKDALQHNFFITNAANKANNNGTTSTSNNQNQQSNSSSSSSIPTQITTTNHTNKK